MRRSDGPSSGSPAHTARARPPAGSFTRSRPPGADPSAFVGALLPSGETGGPPATARHGHGPAFVVEADEYAGNFDAYRPDIAVLDRRRVGSPRRVRRRGAVSAAFEAWLRRMPAGRPWSPTSAIRARRESSTVSATRSSGSSRTPSWTARRSAVATCAASATATRPLPARRRPSWAGSRRPMRPAPPSRSSGSTSSRERYPSGCRRPAGTMPPTPWPWPGPRPPSD